MYHPAMRRTSILLPESLRNRADRHARHLGISFGELVRRALETVLDASDEPMARDALFADDAVYAGPVPDGASVHHDEPHDPEAGP